MSALLPSSQNKRRALFRNASIAAIALLGVFVALSRGVGLELHMTSLVVAGACVLLSMLAFNELDEVGKQAHYLAWWWGGSLALGLGAAALAAASLSDVSFAPVEALIGRGFGDTEGATMFMAGVMSALLLLVAGYALWWAAFWLRRR